MLKPTSRPDHSNDNYCSISPTQELRFLDALMADTGLSSTARIVGFQLVRWTQGDRAHRNYGYSWASRETLGDWIGRSSPTTITTCTKALSKRGWIIIKRRPNLTSLIRPNWDKIETASDADTRQAVPLDQQKAGSPEHQKTELPDLQKTGRNSAEIDSTDKDRVSFPSASHRECQPRRIGGMAATRTRLSNNRPVALYRQTKEEAVQILHDLRRHWPEASDDAMFQPGADSDKAADVRFYILLKEGISANRIQRAAQHFLANVPNRQWPCSLASFLARTLPDYLDPDQPDLYIPPDDNVPDANNDNRETVKRMASGSDWHDDPPF